MSPLVNALNWFEIPATDFERATAFYAKLTGQELQSMEMDEYKMGFFANENGVGGAVVTGEGYVPSHHGSLVYLNVGDDLQPALDRVEPSGGKVLQGKTSIGENGFVAFFEDSEGNKVGLHSMS